MDKFHFTKWEKIFLVLAFLVILMLFVSSSMTYQQQELHEYSSRLEFYLWRTRA